MSNSHLVKRLKDLLTEVPITVHRTAAGIQREVGGRLVTVEGYWTGEGIEVCCKGKSVEEILFTLIHELCHAAGLNEWTIEESLDRAAYRSRALREAAAMKVIEALIGDGTVNT